MYWCSSFQSPSLGGFDGQESTKRKKFRGLSEMWGTKENFAPELIECAYGPQVCVSISLAVNDFVRIV